jgi:hypothetical protein
VILQGYAFLDPYQADTATLTLPVQPGDELIEIGDELTMEEFHTIGSTGQWTVAELKDLVPTPKRHVVIPDPPVAVAPDERLFYHRVGFRAEGELVAREVRDTSDGVPLVRKKLQARMRGEPEAHHDPTTFRRRVLGPCEPKRKDGP